MANPFGSKVRSSSAAKYKAITGKPSGGQTFAGGSRDSKAKAAASGREYNVGGTVSAPSFARGGRSKGKGKGGKGHKTHINIAVVAPNKGDDAATKLPPGLPPGGPPPGLPAGGPPMAPPPGMGPGLPPGGPPPGMPPMKRGGAAYAKGGKVGMKSGAESGPGRLEKAKAYGGNARKG